MKCEAQWFCINNNGKRPTPCKQPASIELEGRRLCYVHHSVVKAGYATLAQVLAGERPRRATDHCSPPGDVVS